MDILVILDVKELEDKNSFEQYIKKEGFCIVENENFVYTASSTTTTYATKAYILEVFKKALQNNTFLNAQIVFLLDETPYPVYNYDKNTNDFELTEEEK